MSVRRLVLGFAAAAAIALTVQPSVTFADEHAEKIVQARQGFYKLVSHNAGVLFAIAKGDAEYDQAAATTAAANLVTLTKMDLGSVYPAGTSKEEMPGKTRALKKIWDTYPAVAEKSKAWKAAIADMAAVAGDGADAIRAKAGALGASCKGCHDDFRAKDF